MSKKSQVQLAKSWHNAVKSQLIGEQ